MDFPLDLLFDTPSPLTFLTFDVVQGMYSTAETDDPKAFVKTKWFSNSYMIIGYGHCPSVLNLDECVGYVVLMSKSERLVNLID